MPVPERNLEAEALYQAAAIIEMSDVALVSVNLHGVITSWNRGAEALYGFTAEESLGKLMSIIVHPDHAPEVAANLERIRQGEHIERFETVRVRKDGAKLNVSVSVYPTKNALGVITGAAAIDRDITERAQILAREQAARAEAERANHAKDAVLAVVSHELRSPLNAMTMWLHLMRSSRLSDVDFCKALDTIERNIKAQTKLVDDLLDVSRIVSGKLRLDLRAVDPMVFIDAAIEALRPTAAAKRIRLDVELDPRGGPVFADQSRLQQVVANLVSNAIKFTPADGHVLVRLERVGSNAVISVIDNGEGIAREFFPYLFDRFRQVDSAPSRAQGGLGLGLAIVRNLVELHGGTVSAMSDGLGKGATFVVRLAINALQTKDVWETTAQFDLRVGSLPSLDGISVLVVDDDADAREALTRFLEGRGAEVRLVGSAADAIDAIKRSRPDVLVSDIGMPGEDGYALMAKVRLLDKECGKRLPAVAVTAFASVEDRLRALAAGFHMHLVKPVDLAELVIVISNLAGRL